MLVFFLSLKHTCIFSSAKTHKLGSVPSADDVVVLSVDRSYWQIFSVIFIVFVDRMPRTYPASLPCVKVVFSANNLPWDRISDSNIIFSFGVINT